MKKLLALALAGIMAASLAACGGANTEKEAEGEKPAYTIAVLADGAGFGTHSFQDVALEGAERAASDFNLKLIKLEVKEVADLTNSLRSLGQQGCDLVITAGATVKDAFMEVAPEYPDMKFALLDERIEGLENVASSSYREQEAAFLLGALGGYMTKTNKIGFVGGISGVIQDRFQFGYEAGAKYVNPDVEITSLYTGSFGDVGKGKEIATMMYSDGCDFIAPTAGACNLGVFQAAQEAGDGKWSFGAANGQFEQMPDKIVASQVKRIDNVAYAVIESLVNGTFKGEGREYGLKEGGVDLMYSTEESMQEKVPQEIKDKLEELRQKIIDGEIVPPVNEDEYNAF